VRRRDREIQVFNVSFLDLLSCALGGVLLLFLYVMSTQAEKPEPKGFLVPLPLAIRIDWDKPVDIDLQVRDPSNAIAHWDHLETECGYLMRDEREATERTWEVYYCVDIHPGTYEVYAHYFGETNGPVRVTLSGELFPADPERKQTIRPRTVVLEGQNQPPAPGLLLTRFELVPDDDGFPG
jgi:hypothetical protein